jgi:hypothetical protein
LLTHNKESASSSLWKTVALTIVGVTSR